MTPDHEAAALDALATNGPAQADAKGYEAGQSETTTARPPTVLYPPALAHYAALPSDDPARIDTIVAYEKGYRACLAARQATYEAGLAATQTTELVLPGGRPTVAQAARADATRTAAALVAAAVARDGEGVKTATHLAGLILSMADPLAAYIEHGNAAEDGDPDRNPITDHFTRGGAFGSAAADFDRHVDEALDVVRGTPAQT